MRARPVLIVFSIILFIYVILARKFTHSPVQTQGNGKYSMKDVLTKGFDGCEPSRNCRPGRGGCPYPARTRV
ncbi:hypothetical protein EDD85DRAFT_153642 [Armillaria nabsnona]|nr:hypothetical protein EDD85DRAFT_153642 [Armillaria nabsnona]